MSHLLDNVVAELSRLPGVGSRTALRLAMHLLNGEVDDAEHLATAILDFRKGVHFCSRCGNISDTEVCEICSDSSRDTTTVCVVEQVADLLSIEKTGQYNGLYCVLGGVISPMHGIGPSDLRIDLLIDRIAMGNVKEIIMAIPASVEGETTQFYIMNCLRKLPKVRISTIARGIGFGDELEYVDEHTITHALRNRRCLE